MLADAIRKGVITQTKMSGQYPKTMYMNANTLNTLMMHQDVFCERLKDDAIMYSIYGVTIETREELPDGKIVFQAKMIEVDDMSAQEGAGAAADCQSENRKEVKQLLPD